MSQRLRKTSMYMVIPLVLMAIGSLWYAVLPVTARGGTTSATHGVDIHDVWTQVTADEDDKCWALDIVLLIDQSCSMFTRCPYNIPEDERDPPSDPDGFRFDAAKDMIDRLLFNRRDQCPKATHRVGVVTFGHEEHIVLSLVQLDPDLGLSEEATSQWAKEYKDAIDEAGTDRSQQGTNFRIAFEAADSMLNDAPPIEDPEDYGPRRQVVILLTDGNPAGVSETVEDYMCSLIEYLDRPQWDERYIWIVALNSGSPYLDNTIGCNESIRRDWEDVARQHGGKLIDLPYNLQLVPLAVRDITTEMLGNPGYHPECGVPFFVDPYVELGTFTFFRDNPSLVVTLSRYNDDDPSQIIYQLRDGEVLKDIPPAQAKEMEMESYLSEAHKEAYRIRRPRPGRWQFDVQGLSPEECQEHVLASYEPVTPRVVFVHPQGVLAQNPDTPYYDPKFSVFFEIVVQDPVTSQSFPQEDGYPLSVAITWTLPSGQTILPDGKNIQPFELRVDERGHWISEEPILVPEKGHYQANLVATARHADSAADPPIFTVFRQTAYYEARYLERFSFAIEEPTEGSKLPCNAILNHEEVGYPLEVVVQLRDEQLLPTDGSKYRIPFQGGTFQATLLDSKDQVLDTIMLTRDAEDGTFRGQLLEGKPVKGCENVRVEVTFVGSYDSSNFVLPVTMEEVSLQRLRSEGVEAHIASPTEDSRLLLHRNFATGVLGQIAPVPVAIELHTLGGDPLDPNAVADGNIGELYTVKLIAPDLAHSENLVLTATERAGNQVLSATGGSTLTDAGTYQLLLTPQQSAFGDGYTPAQVDPYVVTFERRDNLLTSPVTTRSISVAGLAALLAIIGVCLWNWFTRPKGGVTFKHRKTGLVIHEELMGHPWRGLWHRYRSKRKALKDIGLSKLEITRARAPEGASRAINLTAYDEQGAPFIEENAIPSGEEFDLDAEIIVRYD